MTWSLYSGEKYLEPLKFSNGKTQEDVVKDVLDAIKEGHKIIFIHGICGTGKSAIALNIARKLGKSSVVVPIKNLQEQYKRDYEGDKYILNEKDKKLKISVITGRKNHKCKFLEDSQSVIPRIRREIDSNLHDIFAGKKEEMDKKIGKDVSADNYNLPCKIEIKEKNWNRIKEYIQQNKDIKLSDFSDIKDVRRVSVGAACPYWCPVLPDKYDLTSLSFTNAIKKKYKGLNNTGFIFYGRRPGCKFYEQFNSFIESDVIVFNSMKYLLESSLDRKPLTEVEIIDECDEFLDKFANQKEINLDRLQLSLMNIFSWDENAGEIFKEINELIKHIKRNQRMTDAIETQDIIPIQETGIYDLLKIFLKNKGFLDEVDDENYIFEVEETARMFDGFFNETYLTVKKKEEGLVVSVVTTNLAKRFKDMVDKNKIVVMMSGTLHSENVLKSVFGLEDFKIIDAETEQQGRIEVQKTGMEMNCKYSNFSAGKCKRKDYLKALGKCIEVAKKPVLVHVNAYADLPTEQELKEFDIDNLISREKLMEIQKEDKRGLLVDRFKKKETDVLFSTRSGRGLDFPGEECNSIVFTKYPYPNVQDAFWKILSKTKPQHYWDFYKDKARRELWQKIYRGLRFKEDHVFVLSPDERVLEEFENENNN
ncbi:MAG: helicase C-terminal domain-containing protein [archaeon]